MRCSKCGAEILTGPDSALNAHRRSGVGCPSCNAENPPAAKFRVECAKPVGNRGFQNAALVSLCKLDGTHKGPARGDDTRRRAQDNHRAVRQY